MIRQVVRRKQGETSRVTATGFGPLLSECRLRRDDCFAGKGEVGSTRKESGEDKMTPEAER